MVTSQRLGHTCAARRLAVYLLGAVLCAGPVVASGQPLGPFETDVNAAVVDGLQYLRDQDAFTDSSATWTDSRGFSLLSLMEQPTDEGAGGYDVLGAEDRNIAHAAVLDILDNDRCGPNRGFYAYCDGQTLMALSLYGRTGGREQAGAAFTIQQAVDRMVDRTIANQQSGGAADGYWVYTGPGNDSSTTQFAAAGLSAARGFYVARGDAGGRIAAIDAALARTGDGYARNQRVDGGHGYRVGDASTLQQSASALWSLLLSGRTLNDGAVQGYLGYLRNNYRSDYRGNPGYYYQWSSAKAWRLIEAQGHTPEPGNLGLEDLGTLGGAPDSRRDPAADSRPPRRGAGGAGFYAGTDAGWYYDKAYQLMTDQLGSGQFDIPASNTWNAAVDHNYALLVLTRSLGGACFDSDGDAVCDEEDNCANNANAGQADTDGDGVGDACDLCPGEFDGAGVIFQGELVCPSVCASNHPPETVCEDVVHVPVDEQCAWATDAAALAPDSDDPDGHRVACTLNFPQGHGLDIQPVGIVCRDECGAHDDHGCLSRVRPVDESGPRVEVGNDSTIVELEPEWVYNWNNIEHLCQLETADNCSSQSALHRGIVNVESNDPTEVIEGVPGAFYSTGLIADWAGVMLNLSVRQADPRIYTITYAVGDQSENWTEVQCEIVVVAGPDSECDGVDEDLDGRADKDYVSRETTCGVGACQRTGRTSCHDGQEIDDCTPGEGTPELCDGVDNDCDGEVDEGLGQTTCGSGACAHTADNCQGGVVVACDPLDGAADEICDGLDNDCDGDIDDAPTDAGANCSQGAGECARAGTAICVAGALTCNALPGAPADELCDGLDNDCDGVVDDTPVDAGGVCGTGDGACFREGVLRCEAGALACDAVAGDPVDEICNGADDDCDNSIDEGEVCVGPACDDGVQNGDETGLDCGGACDPCVPPIVAPPVPPGGSFESGVDFLYTGPDALQVGVEPDALETHRVGVLTGRVLDAAGNPLPLVEIRVADHPEYGETATGGDGRYYLAANGGGTVSLRFDRDGYLPARRSTQVGWNDYAPLDDVVLMALDEAVTEVALGPDAPAQVHLGSRVEDADGPRRPVLQFPAGVGATMRLPDGQVVALDTLTVRATEYTVGAAGPAAMPAELPPNSGYTYAVELSIDEAIEAGAGEVVFSEPVPFYLDNFLDLPTGEVVPAGYLDREVGRWRCAPNGRVLAVLDIVDGLAQIDGDGDGQPDDAVALATLGIDATEQANLAVLYEPGSQIWRVPIDHFTPWDMNWPAGPPEDAEPPEVPEPEQEEEEEDPCEDTGSMILCESQSLGEAMTIAGTGLQLSYRSDRVAPIRARNRLTIPVSGASVPASLAAIEVDVRVAGRREQFVLPAEPNQDFDYEWDGRDGFGRVVDRPLVVSVTVNYRYPAQIYTARDDFTASFGRISPSAQIIGQRSTNRILLTQSHRAVVGGPQHDADLGGWHLNAHHRYFPRVDQLMLGNGKNIQLDGRRNKTGDLEVGLLEVLDSASYPTDIAVAADGAVYTVDNGADAITRIALDGSKTVVAGDGSFNMPVDGALAAESGAGGPWAAAIGPNGDLYFTDWGYCTVWRVDGEGVLHHIAGNGNCGRNVPPDGVDARLVSLSESYALAIGHDGTIYFTGACSVLSVDACGRLITIAGGDDCHNGEYPPDGAPGPTDILYSPWALTIAPDGALLIGDGAIVWRLGSDGLLNRVAGGGSAEFVDGMLATDFGFGFIEGIDAREDGTILVGDEETESVYLVTVDGVLFRVAGTGQRGIGVDGALANETPLKTPIGIAVGPFGHLYIADSRNRRYVRVALPDTIPSADVRLPSEDGSEIYVFNAEGRHLRTVDAVTRTTVLTFGYDDEDRLTSIDDATGLRTHIERDPQGVVQAIVSPFGQRTVVEFDPEGWLATLTDPVGGQYSMTYDTLGLLTRFTAPTGRSSTFEYDADNRLVRDTGSDGRETTLERVDGPAGYTVTRRSPGYGARSFAIERLPDGTRQRTITGRGGEITRLLALPDGSTQMNAPDGSIITTEPLPDARWENIFTALSARTTERPDGTLRTERVERSVERDEAGAVLNQTERFIRDGQTWLTVHDYQARTIVTTSPLGIQSQMTYDAIGRPVTMERDGRAAIRFIYTADGGVQTRTEGEGADSRTTTYGYAEGGPAAGPPTLVTDAQGTESAMRRDAAGRLLETVGAGDQTIQLTWSPAGPASFAPPGRPAWTVERDAQGRVITFELPDIGDGADTQQMRYDAFGRLSELVDFDDSVTRLDYHPDTGRLVGIDLPEGELRFAHDAQTGRLSTLTAPDGGELHLDRSGPFVTAQRWTGAIAGTVRITVDAADRVASRQVDGSDAIAFAYNADGSMTQAGALGLQYSPVHGALVGMTLGGVQTVRTDNEFGEVERLITTVDALPLLELRYTYDTLGQVTAEEEIGPDGTAVVTDYTYDAIGQLTRVIRDGAEVAAYTYDVQGNRTVLGQLASEYDGRERILSDARGAYTHDVGGRRITDPGGETYEYDSRGFLRAVVTPDDQRVEYILDAQSRRIGRRVDGVVTTGWLYAARHRVAAELDPDGNVVTRYVYASRRNTPDYMIRGGSSYAFVTDHLGSVRRVVDTATGEIAQAIDYDAWGVRLADSQPGFQPFGFAGGLTDTLTGVIHFGARDYDPRSARWLQPDPSGLAGGSTNLYTYVSNSPTNYVDPAGLNKSPKNCAAIREFTDTFDEKTWSERLDSWRDAADLNDDYDSTLGPLDPDWMMRVIIAGDLTTLGLANPASEPGGGLGLTSALIRNSVLYVGGKIVWNTMQVLGDWATDNPTPGAPHPFANIMDPAHWRAVLAASLWQNGPLMGRSN